MTKIVNIKYNWMFQAQIFYHLFNSMGGGEEMGAYGIELFFKRYSGNLDLKVGYCGII